MAHSSEPSSSISFTSSSHISNASNGSSPIPEQRSNLEIISLNKLSTSLAKLLVDSDPDSGSNYSDAEVVVEGTSVGVHRCILVVRSKFFDDLFRESQGCVEKNGRRKYVMSEMLPYGKVGYDAFVVFLSYVYSGKLKTSPPEVSTCVDDGCQHDACRPAIDFAVELTYASSVFQVSELVSLFQRRLLNFVEKALVEDVIPILTVAFHCGLHQVLNQCVNRVARSKLDNISLKKDLPFEAAQSVRSLRSPSQEDEDQASVDSEAALREKRIRNIHRALDSDDVELLKLLLDESKVTLDEACGLHYAVAYCNPKVVSEVLELNLADVNLQNSRGYTVLHMAAMRREPSIVVCLLKEGASVFETTPDGRSAVGICRRLTRPKDYHAKVEQGKEVNPNFLCIDVLEREIRRNPMAGEAYVSSAAVAEDLHMRLLYYENRVAFARVLYPTEAKVAMDIAHMEATSEFPGCLVAKGSNGNSREMDLNGDGCLVAKGSNGNSREMDLNESPSVQNERLRLRLEALSKTVRMGRRYFPHCSQVIDKFMEDDLPDVFFLENGTPEEQEMKRTRFVELKEDVQRAFTKDKAELHRTLSCAAASPAARHGDGAAKAKARKYS